MNKSIHKSSEVFIFGIDGVSHCTHEMNSKLFNADLDVNDTINNLQKEFPKNFNKCIRRLKKESLKLLSDKKFQRKLVVILALSMLITMNPSSSFAFSYMDKITETGRNLLPVVITGINKGILIITALRLFSEYMNGFSKYNVTEIVKDCITVILATTLIPNLPAIFEIIF